MTINWKLLVLCLIWGTNWAVMSKALDYFSPGLFSTLRFVLGSVVLLAFCYWWKLPQPKREDWKWYLLCGLFQISVVFIINQSALKYLEIGVVSTLFFSMPFWLTLLSHFFGDKMTRHHFLGLAIGLLGVFFVLGVNPMAMEWTGTSLLAQLSCIGAGFSWAVASLIIKKKLQGNNVIVLTTYQMVFGTLGLVVFTLTWEYPPAIHLGGWALFCLLFAGIIASAYAYFLWSDILSSNDARQSSISLLLIPAIGTLSGWIFLREELGWGTLLGILLVLTGIWIVNRRREDSGGPEAGEGNEKERGVKGETPPAEQAEAAVGEPHSGAV